MTKPLILTALAAGLSLAGCATGPAPVEVTRFHAPQPVPAGTVAIVPAEGSGVSELEFRSYAAAVAPALERNGFRVVGGGVAADLVAAVGVSRGTREGPRRGPRFSIGLGGASFGRHTGIGGGTGVGFGGKPSYVTGTELFVQLRGTGTGPALWEGRARSEAPSSAAEAQPDAAVARLADALFRGFPGESGRTITVR